MKHLKVSNVLAFIAVFAALGGSAYAGAQITGKDVRNSSLTGKDIKNRSLTGVDIKNRSVSKADLKRGVLPVTRWLLLNEAGEIEEQSGGFAVVSKPGVNGQPTTNPNVYVSAGESLIGNGIFGTIAIQNKIDRSGDGMADPAFAGDVAVGRCNSASINCVPAGTNVDSVFVVRALANNTDVASQTRRVYVQVTP